jgi:hypothetical protein
VRRERASASVSFYPDHFSVVSPQSLPGPRSVARDTCKCIVSTTSANASSAWSTSDKLLMASDVVAVVAALATVVGATVAFRALKQQIAASKRERKSGIYRAVLIDPVMNEIPAFEDSAIALLTEGESAIRDEISTDQANHAAKHIRTLIEEFKKLLRPLSFRLLRAANSLRDEQLRSDLEVAVEALEDKVIEAVSRIVLDEPVVPPLREVLRDEVANVLAVALRADKLANDE